MSKRKGPVQSDSKTAPDDMKSLKRPENGQEGLQKEDEAGDVKSLKALLAREHRKRMPDAIVSPISEENTARFLEQPGIEKDLFDDILKISSDNNLTPDWVLIRALKVYVREHKRTGRL